jgi:hypothetical protein
MHVNAFLGSRNPFTLLFSSTITHTQHPVEKQLTYKWNFLISFLSESNVSSSNLKLAYLWRRGDNTLDQDKNQTLPMEIEALLEQAAESFDP